MYRLATIEMAPGEVVTCYCSPDLAVHAGDRCIVQIGAVLESGVLFAVKEEQGRRPDDRGSEVLRCMTLQDQARIRENQVRDKMAMEVCRRAIEARRLPVRLVRARYSFDRARLTVLFSSDDRVELQDLRQALAREFDTQVEMRQIGVRDEAGMIGGMGPCGRVMCCCSWLKKFDSVNVKMAKNQQLSLSANTISGMCGRLKCCLRYENDMYLTCSRGLPRHGSSVQTPEGRGKVSEVNIPVRKVKVQLEDLRIIEYPVEDIQILDAGRLRRRQGPRRRDTREEVKP